MLGFLRRLYDRLMNYQTEMVFEPRMFFIQLEVPYREEGDPLDSYRVRRSTVHMTHSLETAVDAVGASDRTLLDKYGLCWFSISSGAVAELHARGTDAMQLHGYYLPGSIEARELIPSVFVLEYLNAPKDRLIKRREWGEA
jgi:hypothetical protein